MKVLEVRWDGDEAMGTSDVGHARLVQWPMFNIIYAERFAQKRIDEDQLRDIDKEHWDPDSIETVRSSGNSFIIDTAAFVNTEPVDATYINIDAVRGHAILFPARRPGRSEHESFNKCTLVPIQKVEKDIRWGSLLYKAKKPLHDNYLVAGTTKEMTNWRTYWKINEK